MMLLRNTRRAVLLAISLLSACAATDASVEGDATVGHGTYGSLLAGQFAMRHGDFNTASSELLRARAADPADQELLLQTFIACLNAGRPEMVTLARLIPSNHIAQMVLGDAAAKSGGWAEALSHFQALPSDGMMQLLRPLLMAWAIQGGGDTQQALLTLRPFLEVPRYRAIALLHSALIADLGGRDGEASGFYQQAEAELRDPTPRTALILANWRMRAGQPLEAEHILARMTAGSPESGIALPGMIAALNKRPIARTRDGLAEVYATFASALGGPETTDFAFVMARLAVDLNPDFAAARLLAADIQNGMRRYQASLGLLDEAARTNDPILPIVRLRRAQVLERLERSDEAIREVERIGRDYPDSGLADIQLGELLRIKSRFPEAISAYDRALARIHQPGPNDWLLYYGRGIAHERAGQWAKAEADLQQALTLSPDQPSVLNYLGYSWADMGRHLDKARDMIQRAAERRPNDGAITDSLGWVTFRQGNVKEAVRLLERAVGLEPEDASITDHLGDAYWAIGRKVEAHYQWRRALTLRPTPAEAQKLEAKIKTHPQGAIASGK